MAHPHGAVEPQTSFPLTMTIPQHTQQSQQRPPDTQPPTTPHLNKQPLHPHSTTTTTHERSSCQIQTCCRTQPLALLILLTKTTAAADPCEPAPAHPTPCPPHPQQQHHQPQRCAAAVAGGPRACLPHPQYQPQQHPQQTQQPETHRAHGLGCRGPLHLLVLLLPRSTQQTHTRGAQQQLLRCHHNTRT